MSDILSLSDFKVPTPSSAASIRSNATYEHIIANLERQQKWHEQRHTGNAHGVWLALEKIRSMQCEQWIYGYEMTDKRYEEQTKFGRMKV